MSTATPPTDRQLRYLRTLAARTATTFASPTSRRQASDEIDRLIALSRAQPADTPEHEPPRRYEHSYATAVRSDEVTGFGSSARWRSEPPPATQATRAPHSGATVELLRYTVSAGERVLVGQRHGGHLRVTDRPAGGEGEQYTVEELDSAEGFAPLRALIDDYKARAHELDQIPMASGALAQTLARGSRGV